jgi:hypothetical protein
MWIIASTFYKPCSYGVGNDVPRHLQHTLLPSQSPVLIARLPYLFAPHTPLIKRMTAARLEPAHQAVQRATSQFDQPMHVVRHYHPGQGSAVPIELGLSQLLDHASGKLQLSEDPLAFKSDRGQQVYPAG